MRTQVAIIGAGPAGLVLSHLLHLEGVESIVLDSRSRDEIEQTVRAGVLEQGVVDLLVETGLGARLQAEGKEHRGIHLQFAGESHRVDLHGLTGRSVTVYAQHEVLKDLIAARLAAGGRLLLGVADVAAQDVTSERPRVRYTLEGRQQSLECDVVAACDGSRSRSRSLLGEGRREYARQYPFAWYGILVEAPPSSEELVYAHHERGFALLSTRSPQVQRLYFQVDPGTSPDEWSDDRIWAELSARLGGAGVRLHEGPIFSRAVLQFRSWVCEPMQHGQLFLAGDAAHTVPPTGAKGMNLAIADVRVLSRALTESLRRGRTDLLDAYTTTALDRVWRAQHFSSWMTSMLHRSPDADDFDTRRQVAELRTITGSASGARLLAEQYVGLPLP